MIDILMRVIRKIINEEIKITDEFDGLTAKAEIKNGLLHIVVDKKEDQKPKKLEIKFK